MSDGIKAWHDDLDEWADFCKMADLNGISWSLHSKEVEYAKAGYTIYKLKGNNLVDYVTLMLQVDKVVKRQKEENAEYEHYLKLKKKFEGT